MKRAAILLIPFLAAGCAANRQYHGPFVSAREQMAGRPASTQTAGQASAPAQAPPMSRMGRQTSALAKKGSGAPVAAARPNPAEAAQQEGTNVYDIKLNHPDLPRACKLAFIEFDDTGRLFNPQQLGNVLIDLRKQTNLVLFVFIHGWQNNARISGRIDEFDPTPDGDAQRFKNYLAILSNTDTIKRRDRTIYGVYLGWRGELIQKSPEPLTNRLLMVPSQKKRKGSRKLNGKGQLSIIRTAPRRWTRRSKPPQRQTPRAVAEALGRTPRRTPDGEPTPGRPETCEP